MLPHKPNKTQILETQNGTQKIDSCIDYKTNVDKSEKNMMYGKKKMVFDKQFKYKLNATDQTCSLCVRTFYDHYTLKRHLKNVHSLIMKNINPLSSTSSSEEQWTTWILNDDTDDINGKSLCSSNTINSCKTLDTNGTKLKMINENPSPRKDRSINVSSILNSQPKSLNNQTDHTLPTKNSMPKTLLPSIEQRTNDNDTTLENDINLYNQTTVQSNEMNTVQMLNKEKHMSVNDRPNKTQEVETANNEMLTIYSAHTFIDLTDKCNLPNVHGQTDTLHVCKECDSHFSSEEMYIYHKMYCIRHNNNKEFLSKQNFTQDCIEENMFLDLPIIEQEFPKHHQNWNEAQTNINANSIDQFNEIQILQEDNNETQLAFNINNDQSNQTLQIYDNEDSTSVFCQSTEAKADQNCYNIDGVIQSCINETRENFVQSHQTPLIQHSTQMLNTNTIEIHESIMNKYRITGQQNAHKENHLVYLCNNFGSIFENENMLTQHSQKMHSAKQIQKSSQVNTNNGTLLNSPRIEKNLLTTNDETEVTMDSYIKLDQSNELQILQTYTNETQLGLKSITGPDVPNVIQTLQAQTNADTISTLNQLNGLQIVEMNNHRTHDSTNIWKNQTLELQAQNCHSRMTLLNTEKSDEIYFTDYSSTSQNAISNLSSVHKQNNLTPNKIQLIDLNDQTIHWPSIMQETQSQVNKLDSISQLGEVMILQMNDNKTQLDANCLNVPVQSCEIKTLGSHNNKRIDVETIAVPFQFNEAQAIEMCNNKKHVDIKRLVNKPKNVQLQNGCVEMQSKVQPLCNNTSKTQSYVCKSMMSTESSKLCSQQVEQKPSILLKTPSQKSAVCEKVSINDDSIYKHLQIYPESSSDVTYKCTICGNILSSKAHFKNHMLSIHGMICENKPSRRCVNPICEILECSICKKSFSATYLNRHMKHMHEFEMDKHLGKRTNTERETTDHDPHNVVKALKIESYATKNSSDQSHKIITIGDGLISENQVDTDRTTHSSQPTIPKSNQPHSVKKQSPIGIETTNMPFQLDDPQAIQMHNNKKHVDSKILLSNKSQKIKDFTCNICPKTLSSFFSFQRHMLLVHKIRQFKKAQIPQTCNNETLVRTDTFTHPVESYHFSESSSKLIKLLHLCYICDAQFTNKQMLLMHNQKFHNTKTTTKSGKKVPADQYMLLDSPKRMRNDVTKMHTLDEKTQKPLNKSIMDSESRTRYRKQKCTNCKKIVQIKIDMSRHMQMCLGFRRTKKATCTICKKTLFDRFTLTRHVQAIHKIDISVDKEQKCTFCKDIYYDKFTLLRHIEVDHKTEVSTLLLEHDSDNQLNKAQLSSQPTTPEYSQLHSNSTISGPISTLEIVNSVNDHVKSGNLSMPSSNQNKSLYSCQTRDVEYNNKKTNVPCLPKEVRKYNNKHLSRNLKTMKPLNKNSRYVQVVKNGYNNDNSNGIKKLQTDDIDYEVVTVDDLTVDDLLDNVLPIQTPSYKPYTISDVFANTKNEQIIELPCVETLITDEMYTNFNQSNDVKIPQSSSNKMLVTSDTCTVAKETHIIDWRENNREQLQTLYNKSASNPLIEFASDQSTKVETASSNNNFDYPAQKKKQHKITCLVCNKISFSVHNYKMHMLTHNAYKCDNDKCLYTFKSLSDLQWHKKTHNLDGLFQCDYSHCSDLKFYTRTAFYEHKALFHRGRGRPKKIQNII